MGTSHLDLGNVIDAMLAAILVAGGGALLLGPYLARAFPHVRVADNSVLTNALGYWRFAQRLG